MRGVQYFDDMLSGVTLRYSVHTLSTQADLHVVAKMTPNLDLILQPSHFPIHKVAVHFVLFPNSCSHQPLIIRSVSSDIHSYSILRCTSYIQSS